MRKNRVHITSEGIIKNYLIPREKNIYQKQKQSFGKTQLLNSHSYL